LSVEEFAMSVVWIVIAIGAAAGIILAIALLIRRRQNEGQSAPVTMTGDQWFTIGVVFLGAGIALSISTSPGLLGMVALGIIYMVIGVAKKREEESGD